ncbi:Putative BTB/POZ domain-containing protein [Septoria linicola]|uniref:BTB/POZ domain-containing protein n=1 Tax=Septoria linicola TaxID=215465 RepID=A0A9Q9EKC0_9PEZI|nr:putative BTB/POZ domain-containing protein [Septoria linicola]USW52233.1 Putative BTB/POZ domain-containing protein [Septoria linicola]
MAEYPGNTLKTGAKELLATGLYSDLTIICGDNEFKVHKFALHTQSAYFRKLLGGDFKEGAAAGSISRLPLEENPAIFSVLIKHLYHFTYDDSFRGEVAPGPFAVHVYAAADKYDIEPLRKQAAKRLEQVLDPQDVNTFIETLRAIDENTADETLWEIVTPVLQANMSTLLKSGEFQEMLQDMKALTFRLLALLDPTKGGISKGVEEASERDTESSESANAATLGGPGRITHPHLLDRSLRRPMSDRHRFGEGRRLG